MFTDKIRRNIGTIIAFFGFILLCILTFGNLGEILAEEYWQSVLENLTSIGFVSIGLTCIQSVIRQGIAEQALQRGLNTENTTKKYLEHRTVIKNNAEKMIYLPYFLQVYNKKHTKLRKQDFLINNNFSSEASLYASGSKKLKKEYDRISVHITGSSIKWSTVDIVYDKNGRIITLDEHRKRRLIRSTLISFIGMIGVTFLTGGLFFSPSTEPLWQKFVKLFTYIIAIAVSAVFVVIKEYEKGAFGVPNDLDEINQIWSEFEKWEIPDWVIKDIESLGKETIKSEDVIEDEEKDKDEESAIDGAANLQEEQEKIESVCDNGTDFMVLVPRNYDTVPISNVEK